jgi:hypothetical protein
MHHTPLKRITDNLRASYPLVCKCGAAYSEAERAAYNAHKKTCMKEK